MLHTAKVVSFDYMGVLKGKTAIKLFKTYPNLKQKPYWGNHFWSRGYFISTVGIEEEMIRRYVKYQDANEKRNWNMTLWVYSVIKATVLNGGLLHLAIQSRIKISHKARTATIWWAIESYLTRSIGTGGDDRINLHCWAIKCWETAHRTSILSFRDFFCHFGVELKILLRKVSIPIWEEINMQ